MNRIYFPISEETARTAQNYKRNHKNRAEGITFRPVFMILPVPPNTGTVSLWPDYGPETWNSCPNAPAF